MTYESITIVTIEVQVKKAQIVGVDLLELFRLRVSYCSPKAHEQSIVEKVFGTLRDAQV